MYLYFVLLLMLLVLFCLRTPVNVSKTFEINNKKNHSLNKLYLRKDCVNKHTQKRPLHVKKNYSCKKHLYPSKYSINNCVSCENPRKKSEIKISNFNENTYYHVLDNCVQSGKCRIGEDPINMFPTKLLNN